MTVADVIGQVGDICTTAGATTQPQTFDSDLLNAAIDLVRGANDQRSYEVESDRTTCGDANGEPVQAQAFNCAVATQLVDLVAAEKACRPRVGLTDILCTVTPTGLDQLACHVQLRGGDPGEWWAECSPPEGNEGPKAFTRFRAAY